MRYSKINNQLFIKNRKKFQNKLKPKSVLILHSNNEISGSKNMHFTFRQNSDQFYLSGIDQERTILTICPDHPEESLKEVLFVIKPNKKTKIWEGQKFTKNEVKNISGIKNIYWIENFSKISKKLFAYSDNIYLNYIKEEKINNFEQIEYLRFLQELKKKYPEKNYFSLKPITSNLRVQKEPEEIKLIQHACDITEKSFYRILKFVKPGIREYEIEAEITHEFINNRANGHAYSPVIASGANACILHYIKNMNICENGDLLLLDFGAEYGNYASDCSRTIPVNGKFTPRQKDCYNAVLRVMKNTIQMMKPGNTIKNIHKIACELLQEEMIELGLFTKRDVAEQNKKNPVYSKYFMHGISHFIGLDVHDPGSKEQKLKPGMVLSCEPGIYIEEEKMGIRLENMILITKEEPVDLTKNIPIELDEIEEIMNKFI